MAVSIMCPNLRCRKILVVPTAARGKRVRCFYCGQVLMVPATHPSMVKRKAPPTPVAAEGDGEESGGKGKNKKKGK